MPGDASRLEELRREIAALELPEESQQALNRAERQSNIQTVARQETVTPKQVWGASTEYDWTAPSGQQARLRRLKPEQLVEAGLLNKLNSLSVTVDGIVRQSEGQPPQKALSTEDISTITGLLDLMQVLVPMIVVEPQVLPDPREEPREEGKLYVSDIDLVDRIALMNESVEALAKLNNFRL